MKIGVSRHSTLTPISLSTPEKISIKLQALRDVETEYILLDSQRGLASLCRFSQEVLPAFADAPMLQTAA